MTKPNTAAYWPPQASVFGCGVSSGMILPTSTKQVYSFNDSSNNNNSHWILEQLTAP